MTQSFLKEIKILCNGRFSEDDIKIKVVESKLKRDNEIEKIINEGFIFKRNIAEKRHYLFYNGPLLRFEDFKLDSKLTISVSKSIIYKDVVGLRAKPFYKLLEKFSPDFMPNAFSVMNILITANGKLLVGLRKSGDWDESFECSGGFVLEKEIFSPFISSFNRIFEDFCIKKSEIKEYFMSALYSFPLISETTAIFVVKTTLTSDEILERNTSYEKILVFDNSDIGVQKIMNHSENFHYPSLITLKVYRMLLL